MQDYQFPIGLILAVVGALLILLGEPETPPSIGIAVGILGIGMVATARRKKRGP